MVQAIILCYFSDSKRGEDVMRNAFISQILKASGLALLLAVQAMPAGKSGKSAKAPLGIPLKELAQQAQYIVEAYPLPPFENQISISFSEPGADIPPLPRKAFRFKHGEVFKNVLGSDLPDTLLVFEAGTAQAVRAQRAAALSEDAPAGTTDAYDSPIKEKLLGKEKSVILFLYEVRDDSTVTPADRFEFCAARSYEKGSNRKAVAGVLPKPSVPDPE
jgi:hypothetical protein